MYYLKVFQNHSEYQDFVSGGTMVRPNVSHCIEENHVHYLNNIESFRIFREVFCDNVNETDIEMFKIGIVIVKTDIWKGRLGFGEPETYNVNIEFATNGIQGIFYCSPFPIVITEEQYNQWKDLGDDELLSIILPMFQCQGEAEHTWDRPGSPT